MSTIRLGSYALDAGSFPQSMCNAGYLFAISEIGSKAATLLVPLVAKSLAMERKGRGTPICP